MPEPTSPTPSAAAFAPASGWGARALQTALRGYQLIISPHLGNNCRFQPTCSQFGLQALAQHGALGGSYLTAGRIARCHPWCEGGHDPVPERIAAPPLFSRLFNKDSTAP